MIAKEAKESFWAAVKCCLERFHGLRPGDAQKRTAALRAQLDSPPRGISKEAVYHDEPFNVACNLAQHQLDLADYREKYDKILEEHGW